MNILICDDMKAETDKLTRLLNDVGFEPVVFNSGAAVLEYFYAGAAVDVCFLDIIMPDMSGVVLAEKLRAGGFTGEIIFLSTSNEYAHQSYNVKAFFYLLKPPTPQSVKNMLSELANARVKADTEGIPVNTKNMIRFIKFRELSHIEVIQHNVYFRLMNGDEVEVYATFGEIAPRLLNDGRFVQCHRSFVVNMNDISFIADRAITLHNGKKIPISRSYPDIKVRFMQWIFEGDRK